MSRTGLVRVVRLVGAGVLARRLRDAAVRLPTSNTTPAATRIKPSRSTASVTSSWGVPLVPFKLYKVDDGTGEVTVVANNGRTPSKGSRVRVKGRVSDVATFGGQSRRPAPRAEGYRFQALTIDVTAGGRESDACTTHVTA